MELATAREAVDRIPPGATVAISGIVSLVAPETLVRALGERFAETGEPRDLTLIVPNRTGWSADPPTGLEHLAQPGLIRRVITSSFNPKDTPRFVRMALENDFDAYSFPMGVLFRWLRECAARSPGLLTEVGLNTYADPGIDDAGDMRINPLAAPQDLVRRVEIDGRPCLLYRTLPIDVALVRGSVADDRGNISLHDEPVSAGVKHLAMSARNAGGQVFAQVKYLTEGGSLHPRLVEVPGILVDAVVVDPDSIQSQIPYEPAFTGAVRTPSPPVPPLPLNHQKVILRRAAMELRRGDVVNLGVGIGTNMPALGLEEGFIDELTFSVEHGGIGGVPAMGIPGRTGAFGAHYNPQAIIDSLEVFDLYHGGGLDATFLGFAQIDAEGSVNVSWFNGTIRAPGGFVDITHRTRRVVLCGTLTAGGLEVEITPTGSDGGPRVRVVREGRAPKFIPKVEQVNLHGPSALARGQSILIVTERGVFQVREEGLHLVEIAPGIDLERDIRERIGFAIKISPELRTMDSRLFRPGPMGLRLAPRKREES